MPQTSQTTKKYKIYTSTVNLTLFSNVKPEYTPDKIIFTKLSGNQIVFMLSNVVAVDVSVVTDNTGGASVE